MMKKILGTTLLLASISVSAFAAIPRDQMHIGGLKPGMTMQQVAAIYGMPQKVNSPSKAAGGMYYIAGGLISGWIDNKTNAFVQYCLNEDKVGSERISSTGNICLGMTEADVINRIGRPDKVITIGKEIFYHYYSIEKGSEWRAHDTLLLSFGNERITGITINVF